MNKKNSSKNPHPLVDRVAPENEREALKNAASDLPYLKLSQRQLCDLELLLNGGFSPLTGFLNQTDYESVLQDLRLRNGAFWPMPITLDVSHTFAEKLEAGGSIALRDQEGALLAVMDIESIWEPDKDKEARIVFGSKDENHPAVHHLRNQVHRIYLGGKIHGIQMPMHFDFVDLRQSPRDLKHLFETLEWEKILAFQVSTPMFRAHRQLALQKAKAIGANLLIHPIVGMAKNDAVDHFTRVRCYQKILPYFPKDMAMLSLLPLASRFDGPREILWQALVRKNHGCTHFLAGTGPEPPTRQKEETEDLAREFQDELGITIVPYQSMVYVETRNQYVTPHEVSKEEPTRLFSQEDLRQCLDFGKEIPEWFADPEVVIELRKTHRPRFKQGFTIFFTGLPGAGKSTLAKALLALLLEDGSRPITLLDGDIVRMHLSNELGFSKSDREINVQRIGFVASEITKNHGIAICAPIAPYAHSRRICRRLISEYGGFIEVHVSTPLSTCEQRDIKGHYAKARKGLFKGFTGIDDPYEIPENPELAIDTAHLSVKEALGEIVTFLLNEGYLRREKKEL